jgi:hypothetical protein
MRFRLLLLLTCVLPNAISARSDNAFQTVQRAKFQSLAFLMRETRLITPVKGLPACIDWGGDS